MMRYWTRKVALLAVVASTIGCDQVTKHFATVHLMGAPRQSFLGDSLRLEYEQNNGAFLSLGAGLPDGVRTALFVVGTALLLIGCVVAALRRRWPALPLLGLALLFAGGVSNLVDRVAHGTVIDFLNVADMAIMLGMALLVFPLGGRWERRDL